MQTYEITRVLTFTVTARDAEDAAATADAGLDRLMGLVLDDGTSIESVEEHERVEPVAV